MLGVQKLVFPRLIPQNQEAQFKNNPPKQRIFLYRLDWSYLKKLHPGKHLLPDPWDTIFRSMLFAIPEAYMREIRHQTSYAQRAWDRDIMALPGTLQARCKEAAAAHAFAAFSILTDCLYDPQTKNWCRIWIKNATPQVLSFKFWFGHALSSKDAAKFARFKEIKTFDLNAIGTDNVVGLVEEIDQFIERNQYNRRVAKEFDLQKATNALKAAGLGAVESYEDILKLEYRRQRETASCEHITTAKAVRDPDDPLIQQIVDDTENQLGPLDVEADDIDPEALSLAACKRLIWDEKIGSFKDANGDPVGHSMLPGDQDR